MTSGATPSITPQAGVVALPLPALGEQQESGFRPQDLLKVLRRRQRPFLITLVLVSAFFGLKTVWQRVDAPVFQGGFSLLISDPINQPRSNTAGSSGTDIASVALNESRLDVPTLIRVLESPAVLEPVYSQLRKQDPSTPLPSVSVSLVPAGPSAPGLLASGVLAVDSRGRDPALVRRALELTEKAYLDWSLQQRREKLSEGVRFLDEQAPALQARFRALQSEVEAFRRANSVLLPEEEATAVWQQVSELRSELASQQAERQRLAKLRDDVAAGRLTARSFSSGGGERRGDGDASSLQVNLPDQALLEKLNDLEEQIAAAQATYQRSSPFLRDLLSARDQLRPEVRRKELEAMNAAMLQMDSSMAVNRAKVDQLEAQFEKQPALLRQYADLQRQLQAAEANLASYQRTQEQFQLEIAQNNVPWKIIAPTAVNTNPVEPNLGKGLLQGLLLGLAAGAGVAVLRDRLDHVFHSPAEVRNDLKQPLLGHIPYISFFEGVRAEKRFLLHDLDNQQSGVAGYQRFHYQEAFRNLYTSLRFLSTETPVRSLALSSSQPSEGKSLAIVLLAKTMHELGRRVLLVDADLRKPQMHHRLGLDNVEGLSNLITEDGLHWRDVVQTVPDYPNWDTITAGPRPPDPPRLLSSARMGELVADIAANGGYDLVLYDTPPALGLADASLVAEHLDGIVLLVSLNRVDRALPEEAIKRIAAAGAPLLGVVSNSRVQSGSLDGIYGYGYGGTGRSGYGYGGSTAEAALDPSTAYAYYRHGQGADVPAQPRGGIMTLVPNQTNRRRWTRSLRRWIDS
ncbi:polysaccharide biosynthesis tyrosine autokinase [Synechococcus sp. CS-1328]|uniref:GumC family protein n=1 Tax=Synechococcus sp. CS-1328 TaxID=2847976 RepID=UPI00223BC726|nr:polysaccharide biosynthesis tyrosine autokinase [Synechococcus sp. CS-1328]MCT0225932.1 polysaccharide biosynthesis tyrosine autokinase [Synechococcus sp. CS-1328]